MTFSAISVNIASFSEAVIFVMIVLSKARSHYFGEEKKEEKESTGYCFITVYDSRFDGGLRK